MTQPIARSFKEQINLFAERGMSIDGEYNVKKLEHISYYRLKEFAMPLSKKVRTGTEIQIDYSGVKFDDVLTRYYQDKNLRIYLLHCIEKIEISIKTKLSYILGKQYGAFGYLDFAKWGNREKLKRSQMKLQEECFKKELRKSVKHSRSFEMKEQKNIDGEGFPSVWLAIDVLTFGSVVTVIKALSLKNLKKLSSYYNCSGKELISWLKLLGFIRNLCAHNSNVIDIKLTTRPVYLKEWGRELYKHSKTKDISNRLAVVFLILKHFIERINNHYSWGNISRSIKGICSGKERYAQLLGFRDLKAVENIFPARNKKKQVL